MERYADEPSIKKYIDCSMDGWSVERVLRQSLGVSRTLFRRAKRAEGILLDGKPVKSNTRVKTGEQLELMMVKQETAVIPEKMPLNIIYEDNDLLAINKPPGMLVHPLTNQTSGTLANGVLYHWLQQGTVDKFRPVHRLDRDTSGLVIVAKNPYVHQQLQQQMQQGSLTRCYLALVEGVVSPARGSISAPIGLAEGSYIKRIITTEGKPAISHYKVLLVRGNISLVCVELETGRTHQVRVHMSHLGHPLLGDSLYGGCSFKIKRQALHCAYLAFTHPRSENLIKLTCPMPKDMKKIIEGI